MDPVLVHWWESQREGEPEGGRAGGRESQREGEPEGGRARGRESQREGQPLCSIPMRGTLVWVVMSGSLPLPRVSLVLYLPPAAPHPRIPCQVLGGVKAAYLSLPLSLSPPFSLLVVGIYRPGAKSGRWLRRY